MVPEAPGTASIKACGWELSPSSLPLGFREGPTELTTPLCTGGGGARRHYLGLESLGKTGLVLSADIQADTRAHVSADLSAACVQHSSLFLAVPSQLGVQNHSFLPLSSRASPSQAPLPTPPHLACSPSWGLVSGFTPADLSESCLLSDDSKLGVSSRHFCPELWTRTDNCLPHSDVPRARHMGHSQMQTPAFPHLCDANFALSVGRAPDLTPFSCVFLPSINKT